MALLLPQCTTAPPESLHQLASLRQRLSVQQRHHRVTLRHPPSSLCTPSMLL
jgi:hypothetical protein